MHINTDVIPGSNALRILTKREEVFLISLIIVSITKFSIVIGSPRAYLSRNRHASTWVSDSRCPI